MRCFHGVFVGERSSVFKSNLCLRCELWPQRLFQYGQCNKHILQGDKEAVDTSEHKKLCTGKLSTLYRVVWTSIWICVVVWKHKKTYVSAFRARTQYLSFFRDDSWFFCPSNVFLFGSSEKQVDTGDG